MPSVSGGVVAVVIAFSLNLMSMRDGERVYRRAERHQGIVGQLDAGGEVDRTEHEGPLQLVVLRGHGGQTDGPELDPPAVVRPHHGPIFGLVPRVRQLDVEPELDRALRQALRQLVEQVIGPRLRRGGGVEAREAGDRNDLVAPGSLGPLRVDEHERVVPKIGQRGEARRQRLVVEHELQGPRVAAIALRNARKSSPVPTTKPLCETATMSVKAPPESANRIAMPRGTAPGSVSGILGTPLAFEKRTVTGTVLPVRCAARLSDDAPAAAVNVPVTTRPFA